MDNKSIQQLVANAVKSCSMDMRKDMWRLLGVVFMQGTMENGVFSLVKVSICTRICTSLAICDCSKSMCNFVVFMS